VHGELAHLPKTGAETIQKHHVRNLKNEFVQVDLALTQVCHQTLKKNEVREQFINLCKVSLHTYVRL
jgi:hypothetical protein